MPENPYVGLRVFNRHDAERFFGRMREVAELADHVTAHSVTLFHAQAGAGKTSLINAGLNPMLEAKGYEVLPIARVHGSVAGIDAIKVENIYALHTLLAWAGDEAAPQKLATWSLRDFFQQRKHLWDEEGEPVLCVAIIDQFEELFKYYPERSKERRAFFEQIREALEADRLLRIILALREDHLGELEAYAGLLPGRLRVRFRLERLRRDTALAAVRGPLHNAGRAFTPGVAERIVDGLREVPVITANGERMTVMSEFVDPVQLQVVCHFLWEQLRPDCYEIGMDDLASADPSKALLNFYERCIVQAAERTRVPENKMRRWVERELITPAGTRGTVFRGEEETRGLPNAAVDVLENMHIIRGEVRGGGRWYELTHDRFIELVQTSRQRWLAKRAEAEAIRQRLEARAVAWRRAGGDENYLLNDLELAEAQLWLSNPDADELGYSDSVVALIQAGVLRSKQVQRLGLRYTAFFILGFLVGLAILVLIRAVEGGQ